MTIQVSDTLFYRDKKYAVAGRDGSGMLDPIEHGLKPYSWSTGCRRGFRCHYRINQGRLVLDSLAINHRGPAPSLSGVTPRPGKRDGCAFDYTYDDLDYPVRFSGGLLIGHDRPKPWHYFWIYREIREAIFVDGILVEEIDRSAQIAEIREVVASRPKLLPFPGSSDIAETNRLADACLSREYTC